MLFIIAPIMLTTTHMAHNHAFRIITGQPHLSRGQSLSSTCGNSLRMQNNYCLKITEYGLAAQYLTMFHNFFFYLVGSRGRDRMVVGFTTTLAISACHH
jgi:hypothetical protein